MMKHARIGPSAAERWFVCPGSVALIEKMVASGEIDPNAPNPPADEGTAAHHFRSDALSLGMDAWDFVGQAITIRGARYECTEEMAAFLQPGIDWIRQQPGNRVIEHRVDLGRWIPDGFGTLDYGIIHLGSRTLIINDLKFGFVPVEAQDTLQLRIYALGVLDYYDLWDQIDKIVLVIDQPRNGGQKLWSVTVEELEQFGQEVRVAAARVNEPDAPLVVSPAGCQWCDVKRSVRGCPAWNAHMEALLDDASDPDLLTPERRWEICQIASQAKKWLDQIVGQATDAAVAGNPDPGAKAVPGKAGNREYRDEAKAQEILVAALGDDAFTRQLKSPAQAEALLRPARGREGDPAAWAELNKIIVRPPGKPVLAPLKDRRLSLSYLAKAIDEFEDLN